MNEKQKWNDKWRSFLNLFTNKKTAKGARITYHVFWNLTLLFLIIVILGGAFAGGVGAGYFASLVKNEPIRSYDSMKKDIYNYEETTDLFFADDVYLGKLRADLEREEVKIEEVSDHLINAVISTEDEYFYEHNGVVPKAIIRALLQEVSNSSVQSGGSTLTQQLIKNQILTNEVSFERKAKEILLALRLEKFFNKKEILEAYLNVATFGRNSSGQNIAGVQAAAKGIFGVNANKLNLPQAAFIAGLPQSPFGYTPFTNEGKVKGKAELEPGLAKMQTVLKRMYDDNKISKQEYKKAISYNITKDFVPPTKSPQEQYPWLTYEIEKRSIDILAKILAKKDGYKEEDLEKDKVLNEEYLTLADRSLRQNGYEIHTTINKKIYDQMKEVATNYLYYGSDKPDTKIDSKTGKKKTVMEPVELGAVLIENKTGKIISFVGGRDHNNSETNHATIGKRPNGSTMKPLLVYAPGIELGTISPGSILPDVPLRLDPSRSAPWPSNYTGGYSGLVTARYALEKSYNVPAVKAYVDILSQKPAKYLEKMGFTSLTEGDYQNRSTALGGLEKGVTVEENVNAFGTFANDGKFIDAYMINKIVDKNGEVIYKHKTKPIDVFSPQTAYLTLDMLRGVITQGTATSLNSRLKFSSDWAGKTGTGQNYNDSWFVATNPNVSFGVWIGYDTPKSLELSYKGLSYGVRNIYLWADLINAAYDIDPELIDSNERFKMPGGIVRRSFCAVSGLLPSEGCSKAGLIQTDLFNAKYVPTKVDDSFINGKFVRVGTKKYLGLDSTPEEFSESGFILNPDYIEKLFGINVGDPSQLLPNNESWAKIVVPSSKLNDNGKSPGAITINTSGSTISWGQHSENDVIGYRIYNKSGSKVGSIKSGSALSFKVGNGAFYVTAVDIAGKESSPSNIVQIGMKEEKETENEKSSPKEDTKVKSPEQESQQKDPKEENPNPPTDTQEPSSTDEKDPVQDNTDGQEANGDDI